MYFLISDLWLFFKNAGPLHSFEVVLLQTELVVRYLEITYSLVWLICFISGTAEFKKCQYEPFKCK